MQRIAPPPQPALLVTRGAVTAGPTLSELGVFGTFLAVDNDDDNDDDDNDDNDDDNDDDGGSSSTGVDQERGERNAKVRGVGGQKKVGEGKSSTVLVNEYAGHILRTKLEGVDEGGVATGFAVLSSPLLVD
jgi:hypothetical protein